MTAAREVYQKLKELCLGTVGAQLHSHQRWSDVDVGLVAINVDGWIISLNKEAGALDYCAGCQVPDGRYLDSHTWASPGNDPLEFLSVWERGRLESVLQVL